MRTIRAFLFVLFILAALPCWAQTAITGTLQDTSGNNLPNTGASPSGTWARFTLMNHAQQIPQVIGTGVFPRTVVDMYPNASGQISGTLYGNNLITPPGTFYRVTLFFNGQAQTYQDYCNIQGPSWNLNTAAPCNTTPPPFSAMLGAQTFTCSQAVAATTWTCAHNFGNSNVITECFNASSQLIWPDTIVQTNNNVTTITWVNPTSGTCTIMDAGQIAFTNTPSAILSNPVANQTIQNGFSFTLTGPFNAQNGGSFTGTFSGSMTNSGTNIWSGINTFTGQVLCKNFENIRCVDSANAVGWSGSDLGAWVNSALANLPTLNGKPFGKILFSTASYSFSTPILISSPYVILDLNGSALTYTGSAGNAIKCTDAPTSYAQGGGIINGSLSSSVNSVVGVDVNECTGIEIHDFTESLTGTSDVGIRFENTQKWTEQSDLENVLIFAANPYDFEDNCASHSGCPSFAYGNWRHVTAQPASGGTGYLIENDSNINGGTFNIRCFGANPGPVTCFSAANTSVIIPLNFTITGESASGSNTGISAAVGTIWQPFHWEEHWNTGTWSDSISGSLIPYIDAVPGFGQIFRSASGIGIGNTGGSFYPTLDSTGTTAFNDIHIPNLAGTLTENTQNVSLQQQQFIANQGTACTNGELALSSGWQSTGSATVTAVAGNGQTCSWTITTGTTTAANPTVTDTLTNALPGATTVCEMNIHGGTHTAAAGEGFQQTTLSATAPVFTFNGTPTAGNTTYFVTRRCGP